MKALNETENINMDSEINVLKRLIETLNIDIKASQVITMTSFFHADTVFLQCCCSSLSVRCHCFGVRKDVSCLEYCTRNFVNNTSLRIIQTIIIILVFFY